MKLIVSLAALCLCASGYLYGQSGNAVTTTPLARTTSAAFTNLSGLSQELLLKVPGLENGTIVIADQSQLSLLATYTGAVEDVSIVRAGLCRVIKPKESLPEGSSKNNELGSAAFALDPGSLLSGLADLLKAVQPTYTTQSATLNVFNDALIAEFMAQPGVNALLAKHLLPTFSGTAVPCDGVPLGDVNLNNAPPDRWSSVDFVQNWKGASEAAIKLKAQIDELSPKMDKDYKKTLQDALAQYDAMKLRYIASDKGDPLLSKLLTTETLVRRIRSDKAVQVLDLEVDSVAVDSISKTLFRRKALFSTSATGHYFVIKVEAQEDGTFVSSDMASGALNVFSKDLNEKDFGKTLTEVPAVNIRAAPLSYQKAK